MNVWVFPSASAIHFVLFSRSPSHYIQRKNVHFWEWSRGFDAKRLKSKSKHMPLVMTVKDNQTQVARL